MAPGHSSEAVRAAGQPAEPGPVEEGACAVGVGEAEAAAGVLGGHEEVPGRAEARELTGHGERVAVDLLGAVGPRAGPQAAEVDGAPAPAGSPPTSAAVASRPSLPSDATRASPRPTTIHHGHGAGRARRPACTTPEAGAAMAVRA